MAKLINFDFNLYLESLKNYDYYRHNYNFGGGKERYVVPQEEIKRTLERDDLKLKFFGESHEFEYRYYPECVIEAIKNTKEEVVIKKIREKITSAWVLIEEIQDTSSQYFVFCSINLNQNPGEVEQGILEVSICAERVFPNERFGKIKIPIDFYLNKNILFFKQLEYAKNVTILLDNTMPFPQHTLIKAKGAITSIETFINGIEASNGSEMEDTKALEAFLNRLGFKYEYKERV